MGVYDFFGGAKMSGKPYGTILNVFSSPKLHLGIVLPGS
jgi:hypothetical protein